MNPSAVSASLGTGNSGNSSCPQKPQATLGL